MDKRLAGALDRCNKQLLEYKRQCDTFMVVSGLGTFPASLERVMGLMQKFMERHKGEPVTNELLEFFFAVRHFLNMYDCADENMSIIMNMIMMETFLYICTVLTRLVT